MSRVNKKIAFIKLRNFSHTNAHVLRLLKRYFPEYQVDVLDVLTDLIGRNDPLAALSCLNAYGKDIVLRRKTLSEAYFLTPYLFRKIERAVHKRLHGGEYAFTIQTQSLFDAVIPGIPHFVYTDHTSLANLDYPGFIPDHLPVSEWMACERQIYHHATLNFTMSSNISCSIIEDYQCRPDKVECIGCGPNIEVKEDEPFDDSRYAKKNVLFVGIHWKRKGGPALVKAFSSVLNRYPEATLTIVGCRPPVTMPHCTVTGKIPLHEVKRHLETASLFCMPTTREPFGIAFLEAMTHKLPVIGTRIGGQPEFIHEGRNGFLVAPNDADEIAARMIEVLGSEKKAKALGEYGHRLAWDRYTWEKTGEKMHAHIRKWI